MKQGCHPLVETPCNKDKDTWTTVEPVTLLWHQATAVRSIRNASKALNPLGAASPASSTPQTGAPGPFPAKQTCNVQTYKCITKGEKKSWNSYCQEAASLATHKGISLSSFNPNTYLLTLHFLCRRMVGKTRPKWLRQQKAAGFHLPHKHWPAPASPNCFHFFPPMKPWWEKRQERTIPVQYLFLQKRQKLREKTSNITQPTHLPAQQWAPVLEFRDPLTPELTKHTSREILQTYNTDSRAIPNKSYTLLWFNQGANTSCDHPARVLVQLWGSRDGHETPSRSALALGAHIYI